MYSKFYFPDAEQINFEGSSLMFPSFVSYDEVLRFRRLLGQKGSDKIDWNVWKYSYRKKTFETIAQTFKFLGFSDSDNVLTPLGKRFVFGNDDKAIVVGLIQSDYFTLYRELLKGAKSKEDVLNSLSLECGAPTPEKERRSMFATFIDFSTKMVLLKISKGKVSLTPKGSEAIERHGKVPLWVYDLPLFDECRRIERFKALYYETGHLFRDIVKEAFLELGFEAINLPKKAFGIPDIMISATDFEAVVETKGENKQIGENDVNQLSKAQSKPEFKNKKLIFVGNAFRLKPPNQRGAFFHEAAINLAESKGITLLSSLTLINALQNRWKRTLDLHKVITNLSKSGLCSTLA
jgi:hypothetical protein